MKNKSIMMIMAVLVSAVSVLGQQDLPKHPDQITYAPLDFKLPAASQYREVLSNGMVIYIDEDRMLPTFDLSITLRTGAALDPAGKAGLAGLVGDQIRDGGTIKLLPEELDERIDFLAANMSTRISDTRGRARLSCLSKDIEESLTLFVEMLRYPRFDEKRLRLAKDQLTQNVKRRNDSTNSISRLEWGFLMDGEKHFSNRYTNTKSIQAITRDDLFTFHKKYFHPGNMIVAVAGDFDRVDMLRKLESHFGAWPLGETGPATFDKPKFEPTPGVYMIHKDGVNQGRVAIGHKSVQRGNPDEFPLMVMNGILGASGFRSRLVARVRSNEGLAYNTGSRFALGVYYPGNFQAWFQSKSNSCAYATRIVLEEIERMRSEIVTQQDLDDAIAYYTESFPQRFQSKMSVLGTYASDEYTGRDTSYWQSYVENLKKVRPEDVRRVAKKYLHPDQLVILAVGDVEAMRKGGYDKAPDLKFDAFGPVKQLSLRDPDTLKR